MGDLGTMVWKELGEFFGNARSLRVFALSVLLLGVLPSLKGAAAPGATVVALVLGLVYTVLSAAIVVAQTAPDLVLHERSGRTLDYLLATRLPDGAILGGKVLVAAAVGYASSLLNAAVQVITGHLRTGGAWSWGWLATPQGRLIGLGVTLEIAVYLAVVGTFVALRVGDQRSAYLVTMLAMGVLVLPFLLHLVVLHFTVAWLWGAVGVFGVVVVALVVAALALFRRERIVLYLQE